MKLGELFVELFAKTNKGDVNDFRSSLKSVVSEAGQVIAVLTGVSFTIDKVMQDALGASSAFNSFTSQTGGSAQELQKWQIIAERANGSANGVAQSMMNLYRNISDIRMGRGNIAPFQLLGIDPNSDPFSMIEQVRERIKGMNRPMAMNLLTQMGFTPDMIQVLQLTNRELLKFNAPGMILSQDGIVKIQNVQREMRILKETFFASGRTLVADFAPGMIQVGKVMEGALDSINKIKQGMKDIPGAVQVAGVALAGLLAILNPITAGFLAFLVVMQDISYWEDGKKSLIGKLFGKFKNDETPGNPDMATGFGRMGQYGGMQANKGWASQKYETIMNHTVNMYFQGLTGDPAKLKEIVTVQLREAVKNAVAQTNKAQADKK